VLHRPFEPARVTGQQVAALMRDGLRLTLGARQFVVSDPLSSSDYAFLLANSSTGEKTVIEPPEKPPEFHFDKGS